jgi:hypothetical protein
MVFLQNSGEWRALPPVPVLVGILDGLVADPERDEDDEQEDDEVEHVLHHPVHHRHHGTEIFTAQTLGITIRHTTLKKGIRRSK